LQGRDIRLLILIALAVDMNYGNEVQEKQVRELALKHHQIRTNVLNRLVSAGMITRRRDGVPYKISVTPQGWRIIETFLKRANYYINEISKKDRDKCAKLSYLLNID
jgi:DNA-binding MarR family transcriptional regulator